MSWYQACLNVNKPSHYLSMNFNTLFPFFPLQEKVAFPCIRLKTSDRQVSKKHLHLVTRFSYQRAISCANTTTASGKTSQL